MSEIVGAEARFTYAMAVNKELERISVMPQSTCIATANGSQEIHAYKISAFSDGFSYPFLKNSAGTMSQAFHRLPSMQDPGANAPEARSDRHSGLLEFVQQSSGVKENVEINLSRSCRFCKKRFSSGRALGGHMRVHSSQESAYLMTDSMEKDQQLSISVGKKTPDPIPEDRGRSLPSTGGSQTLSSTSIQFTDYIANGSEYFEKCGAQTKSSEDLVMRSEEEDATSVRARSSSSEANNDREPFPDENEFPSHQSTHPLYTLRRNPKPSRRFVDQEFPFDAVTTMQICAPTSKRTSSPSRGRTRACSQCGKHFLSWKALFGHMRCHPEREWRGIQPPENVGQENKAGLEGDAPRRRPAIYSIIRHESGLEFDFNIESNKESIVKDLRGWRQESIIKAHGHADEFNKGREGEVSTGRRHQEGVESQLDVLSSEDGQDRATSSMTERKFSHSELNELASSQEGSADAWSRRHFHGWVTGKRSKRCRHTVRPLQILSYQKPELNTVTTPAEIKEERDMADCLVMLAYAGRRLEESGRAQRQLTEESAFSDSRTNRSDEHGTTTEDSAEEEMKWINKRGKVSQGCGTQEMHEAGACDDGEKEDEASDVWKKGAGDRSGKFECHTCKRLFSCHQALGGHRASHRRVKGCSAKYDNGKDFHESLEEGIIQEDYLRLECKRSNRHQSAYSFQQGHGQQMMPATAARRSKGHECSICHLVFASGQALGGHKRRHWTGERTAETTSVSSSNKQALLIQERPKRTVPEDILDLNLPAPIDNEDDDNDDDLDVAYGTTQVLPSYRRLMGSKNVQESSQVLGLIGVSRECDTVGGDNLLKEKNEKAQVINQAGKEIAGQCKGS